MASITVRAEGGNEKYALESATVTLGRGLESDIRLKDIKASRRHCQIVKTADGYQVVDLGSGNGTYINGVQIKQKILSTGDTIQIGSTTLTFHDGSEEKSPAAKAPAKPDPPPPRPSVDRERSGEATAVVGQAPAAAKTGAAKASTGPVPATTKKAPAVAAAAKPEPPPAQPAAKAGTQPLSKAGASSTAKRLGAKRLGAGTRPAGKLAAARAAGETAPKRRGPVVIAIAVVGLLALAGAAYLFLGGSSGGQKSKDRPGAVRKDSKSPDDKSSAEPPAPKSREPSPSDPRGQGDKKPDYEAQRGEILEKHLKGVAPNWGGAVKAWQEFMGGKVGDETRAKVEEELRSVNAKAKEEVARLARQAEEKSEQNKRAEALKMLREQRPRFEHTQAAEELDKLVRQYDK